MRSWFVFLGITSVCHLAAVPLTLATNSRLGVAFAVGASLFFCALLGPEGRDER